MLSQNRHHSLWRGHSCLRSISRQECLLHTKKINPGCLRLENAFKDYTARGGFVEGVETFLFGRFFGREM